MARSFFKLTEQDTPDSLKAAWIAYAVSFVVLSIAAVVFIVALKITNLLFHIALALLITNLLIDFFGNFVLWKRAKARLAAERAAGKAPETDLSPEPDLVKEETNESPEKEAEKKGGPQLGL